MFCFVNQWIELYSPYTIKPKKVTSVVKIGKIQLFEAYHMNNFLQYNRLIGTICLCIIYLVGPTTYKN